MIKISIILIKLSKKGIPTYKIFIHKNVETFPSLSLIQSTKYLKKLVKAWNERSYQKKKG